MQQRNDSEKYNINPAEFNKMDSGERIMKMAEGLLLPPGKPEQQVLDALLAKIDESEPVKVIRLSKYLQAAAAVLVFLIGFYTVSTVFSKDKVTTQLAETTEFSLPDGSNVILNADSKITWSGKKFLAARELTLKGEAYFDVEKGSKFTIHTPNGNVEILGTQLNVYSRNNEFWVSCISGKVKVTSNGSEQIITPGEIARLTDSGLLKNSENNINQTISWQHGEFYFEDKPLVSIFDELERQFNVSVNFKSNKERTITVSFTNKNLQEALDVICIPMGLSYEIQNKGKVKIFEKPN